MKLIKLEINNFRQFYGKQVIEFATDDKFSVTLIHGENNGGKTALLNALKWCLYEETTDNLQDPNFLINKHALAEKKNTYSVIIQLIHDNRIIEVQRTATHSPRKNTLKVFEISDNGCYAESAEKTPNTLINSLLPKEMSDYFFYQGEGTGTLSSQNDFSHIKGAISKVLGLTVAEKTLSHLSRIKNDYMKELLSYDTSSELEQLSSLKEQLTFKLKKNKEALEVTRNDLVVAEKAYNSNMQLLTRFDKSVLEERIKAREALKSSLRMIQRDKASKEFNYEKDLPKWLSQGFNNKLAKFDLDKIDIRELKNSHKYSVDKNLISEILSKNECICGSELPKESPSYKLIEELQKSAVDISLKRRWQKVTALNATLSKENLPTQAMLTALTDIENCNDQILYLQKEIEELSQSIIESDVDDIKKVEAQISESQSNCNRLMKQLSHLEVTIEKLSIDLRTVDQKLIKLGSSQPMARKFKVLIEATDQIINLYDEAIKSASKDVDLDVLRKMKVLFSRVAFNGYSVRKEQGHRDSFTWVIVDSDGKKVAAGNGYQAMLAISFIIALIQFSKDRAKAKQHLLTPGAVAPFIADSILAFIGPDNGKELVRFISESVEQSIFMFSQAQWTETHIDKGFRDKIGKEYNLIQHTVLTEDEFKGAYPTKLIVKGNEFDVVRFGSEFDKVTIEEVVLNG
ncbi:AAA family ATPase [Pseudoalteromonas distincta]|uniref:AAA family ATPase n=1 Tax=Pseudoalteromonas distincta TaxID=77608 RepID=UPI002340D1F8|nr:AAA family ATPase [Pseudoalteromonas distincta]MDC3214286.1 AAA family ATPase [Pseudoalteromonas distincta]